MNNKYQKENYDRNFAKFYDYYLTGQADHYGKFIIRYMGNSSDNRRLVDLMCGTGNLLQIFESSGWETYGVDISRDMLEIASRKLKNTELSCEDALTYSSALKFDVVTATADAVNHLHSLQDVKKVLQTAYSLLKENGTLFFDMNTILGIEKNNFYISSSDDNGLSIREGFVDKVNKVGFTRFQGFFRESEFSSYLRFDSIIYNYFYNISTIRDYLLQLGFQQVDIKDDYSDEEWRPEKSERVLFICKK